MNDHSEVFVGIDTSKLRHAVAIAEAGRTGEVRFLGEIENSEAATIKLVKKLAARHRRLTFCYEAGPTGYGLHRLIKRLGHECMVVAPSLIPKKPGDRVKTNRRDALNLASCCAPENSPRSGFRMRGTRRCGTGAGARGRGRRPQVQTPAGVVAAVAARPAFYGKRTWTRAAYELAGGQKLAHREQRIAFEEMLLAVRQAEERVVRLDQAIRAAVPDWSLQRWSRH